MAAATTVFVVDNNADMRTLYGRLLQPMPLTVKAYSSAVQFLEEYHQGLPGCLILDIQMPEMSGLELQEKLREKDCQLPIIFVTGYADVRMVVKAMSNGAFDFLVQPFRPQELIDRIHDAIELNARKRKNKKVLDQLKESYARLTVREREITELVVDGMTNKQIAARLGVTTQAIDACRGRAMKKLDVDSVAELVRHAYSVQLSQISP